MTGGGTLGHCLPCLALLPYVKNSFKKIVYIGSFNGREKEAVEGTLEYMCIPTTKLRRGMYLSNLAIPFTLAKAVAAAKRILKEIGADIVFSKGGYVSVPVCLAANALKIPVICHESDLSMGLANKLTARNCKYVLTSFESTAEKLDNGVYVGPPIAKSVLAEKKEEAKKVFSLTQNKPVLLVVGGSSGAKALNDLTTENIDELLKEYEVLHICGSEHISDVKRKGYRQVGFVKDMALAYSLSDYALSRCGSNTAFELIARKIPTVFVPLPKKASRGDQIQNARYFLEKGMSVTLKEEDMSISALKEKLYYLSENRERFIRNMSKLDPDRSLNKMADIVISTAQSLD